MLNQPCPVSHASRSRTVRDFESGLSEGGLVARLARRAATRFADDAIEVVVTRLDLRPDAVRVLATWLSDAERQRAGRFEFDRDRRRFIVARAWLQQLLAARLGVRPESVALVYGGHGKPALAPRYANVDLRFNVSHSDDVAVYAFATGREIGIDVEAVRAIRDADDIAARLFSRREKEAYLVLDPRDRPLGFFNCWTRKEAFIKALGDGLSIRSIASMFPLRRVSRRESSASKARPGTTAAGRFIASCPDPD